MRSVVCKRGLELVTHMVTLCTLLKHSKTCTLATGFHKGLACIQHFHLQVLELKECCEHHTDEHSHEAREGTVKLKPLLQQICGGALHVPARDHERFDTLLALEAQRRQLLNTLDWKCLPDAIRTCITTTLTSNAACCTVSTVSGRQCCCRVIK